MKRILLLLCLILPACKSAPPALPQPKPTGSRIYLTGKPEWRTITDAKRDLGSKATVTGSTINLNGHTLDGSKIKHPKDKQDESAIPIRIRIPGLTLRNGTVSDIPGGLLISAPDVTLHGLKFIEPGEDYVSTTGADATGLTIRLCEFYNDSSGDKSLQANNAQGLTVRDTLISGGITGARVQESSYPQRNVRALFDNVRFVGNETALNIDGDTTVTAKGCTFNVGKQAVIGPRAKLNITP